jgi:hypothetical protein
MYSTTIKLWSRNGHTPLTGRGGSFCDELLSLTIDCAGPSEAEQKALDYKNKTKGAYSCHYNMPDYPNQNTRSRFCHYG